MTKDLMNLDQGLTSLMLPQAQKSRSLGVSATTATNLDLPGKKKHRTDLTSYILDVYMYIDNAFICIRMYIYICICMFAPIFPI